MNNEENATLQNNIAVNQKQIEQGHELGDWFIFREKRHFGPLTTKQVNQFLLNGLVSVNHHIWRPSFKSWIKINDIESFKSCGRANIEKITDNDFSFQAQLGPIDRIQFQDTEMTFENSSAVKVMHIKVQENVNQKIAGLKDILIEGLDLLGAQLGLNDENRKYYKIGFLGASIFVVFLLSVLIINATATKSFISELPEDIKKNLVTNAKIAKTTNKPSLVFVEKDATLKDPVFVGSINLPVPSKLRIDIIGKPETLLNSYRFKKTIEIGLTSAYFQTGPIRGEQGEYLPAGEYNISVTCLSCDKPEYNLYEATHKFGITKPSLYLKELNGFQIKTRQSALVELDELAQLNDTLMDQHQKTTNIYNRSISSKNLSTWNQFSVDWLVTQKNIVEMFDQLQAEDLKSKIYYLTLYQAYGVVTQMIFELHVLQDKLLTGTGTNIELAGQINNLAQNIKLKLTYLNSQVDLMKVNYKGSKKLPPRKGLNLKDFK